MLSQNVFSGVLWMDMLSVAQCPEIIGVTAIQWTPAPVFVYNCSCCAQAKKGQDVFESTAASVPIQCVSSVYKAIQSNFIDVFQCCTKFCACDSIKEYVPSSDTTGNRLYCLKSKQKKSLALASVCPLKCLFVCTASHCVNIDYSSASLQLCPCL